MDSHLYRADECSEECDTFKNEIAPFLARDMYALCHTHEQWWRPVVRYNFTEAHFENAWAKMGATEVLPMSVQEAFLGDHGFDMFFDGGDDDEEVDDEEEVQ